MKPQAIIVDCDGTLADVSSIRHHVIVTPENRFKNFERFHSESVNVPPIPQAVDIAKQAHADGLAVLVVTARRHKWRHHTAWFLAMHDIPSDALFMRHDQDHRSDVDVKRDILAQIRRTWTPVLAVDDNPSVCALWVAEGIETVVIPGWE
jgi:beta-phosphoglucomutase-like phosphatase (HAD superfamily)